MASLAGRASLIDIRAHHAEQAYLVAQGEAVEIGLDEVASSWQRSANRHAIDPDRTRMLGVALDVYHIWWDFELMAQIARAGKDRILAFHVCDWLVPTKDILNDRGMMGDGVIDIKRVRAAVEAQGFAGYSEIEIFSNDWWAKPMDEVLRTCIERHRTVV